MTEPGMPPRELVIDDALVAALLTAQHPDLGHLPRHVAAEGWDNVIVRLGDSLALRLPRRATAAELVRNEQRWLGELAPRLPVPVPAPLRHGHPQPGYPWHWSVQPWLPGVRAADRPRPRATAWAARLAQVLAALHEPAPPDAPHNPVRAVPLGERDAVVNERLARGTDRSRHEGAPGPDLRAAAAVWRRGVEAPPWPGPRLWVHGDPHPANLLVRRSDTGADELAALLDFGDLSAGDPACDLATAWLTFDAEGHRTFVVAYESAMAASAAPVLDPGRWQRAAAWAVSMASSILVDAPDDPANGDWAAGALARLTGSTRERLG